MYAICGHFDSRDVVDADGRRPDVVGAPRARVSGPVFQRADSWNWSDRMIRESRCRLAVSDLEKWP